jgi:hypothetical protein
LREEVGNLVSEPLLVADPLEELCFQRHDTTSWEGIGLLLEAFKAELGQVSPSFGGLNDNIPKRDIVKRSSALSMTIDVL